MPSNDTEQEKQPPSQKFFKELLTQESGSQMSTSRPTRDEVLMAHALLESRRSTCTRKQVGALVSIGGRIITTGYAGSPSGMPHCTEVGCLILPGMSGCQRTGHAEINAITYAAKHGLSTNGGTLYCTLSPCLTCSKSIITAGIVEVHYLEEYRVRDGIDLLQLAGIPCIHHG